MPDGPGQPTTEPAAPDAVGVQARTRRPWRMPADAVAEKPDGAVVRRLILGSALMDLAARDTAAAALLDRLVRSLPRDQDRKAFEGWSPETALPDALRPEDPG